MYKTAIYTVSVLISLFALSGINFNNVFKKDYSLEAKIFVIVCAFSLGYLFGSFIISFIESSRIY